jgi:hypothetical protein
MLLHIVNRARAADYDRLDRLDRRTVGPEPGARVCAERTRDINIGGLLVASLDERGVVPTCSIPCYHSRSHIKRPGDPAVCPMILVELGFYDCNSRPGIPNVEIIEGVGLIVINPSLIILVCLRSLGLTESDGVSYPMRMGCRD